MSRIVSLSDLNKKKEGNDDPEEYFAGGTDQRGGGSGQNVYGPPPGGGMFEQIAQSVRQSGASTASGPREGSRRIYMYRNGFTIDNGPFRDFSSPENQRFLESIRRNEVPEELEAMNKGLEALPIDIFDKSSEDYVLPPPPAYVPFSKANTLGEVEVAEGALILTPEFVNSLPTVITPVNESQPTTTIQVRTLDGKRLKIRMNQNSTILQLVIAIKSQYITADTYVLTSGFPPVDIQDRASSSKTLAEAKLLNSAVTLKKI